MKNGDPTSFEAIEELRSNPRRNLLVLGRLSWADSYVDVRIRNVSEGGALIEATDVPQDISIATLAFTSEKHDGSIVWRNEKHLGFQFSQPRETLSRPSVATIGQARVDRSVSTIKKELHFNREAEAIETETSAADHRVAEELLYIQRRLESLGDVLSGDPILIVKHHRQLQDIDIIMQSLGHIANVLKSHDRAAAIRTIGREDLRRRLSR